MNLLDPINENIDIKKMYDFKMKEFNKDEYQKYKKFLTFYYQKEHKKEKYKRDFIDHKIVLTDKQNPKKVIKILPSDFIDIHKLYIELKNTSDYVLYRISELIETKSNITEQSRTEFDILKKKYLIFKEKIKDLDDINNNFYSQIGGLLNERLEKSNLLAKYFYKRHEEYSNISVMIPEKLKNNLIKLFKENNKDKPPLKTINKLAKENNVPSTEIEKWFSWIDTTYKYIIVQKEINSINDNIKKLEDSFELNSRFMIIQKPIIED